MKTIIAFTVVLCISGAHYALAKPKNRLQTKVASHFIARIAPIAVEEGRKHNIPPSAIISQAILESNYGRSALAREGNNYFGIKAYYWKGKTIRYKAHDGVDKYRRYSCLRESVIDYCKFVTKPRYRKAFQYSNGEDFVRSVARLGYCTDKQYAFWISEIISRYDLSRFD